MSGNTLRILFAAFVVALAGCGPTEDVGPMTKPEGNLEVAKGGTSPAVATCPAHLIHYCRGWFVTESSAKLKVKHMDVADRFRIDVNSGGSDPNLWLFARNNLETRWNGKKMFKLTEIETAGSHECLAGKIRLTSHPDGETPHEWHQATIRSILMDPSDTAGEKILEVCFAPADNGSPPSACEVAGCPQENDPRLHGGRAHAQD